MKRIRYDTLNSWNGSTSIAYNMKVYNVIPKKYQERVYELMQYDNFYDDINWLIDDFNIEHDYKWQAGFNGRSGGYLVLYKGGRREDGTVFSYPGKHIELNEIPVQVRKDFKQLANDIVASVIYMAKNSHVEEYKVTTTKKRIVN